jgi:hypothetical protein
MAEVCSPASADIYNKHKTCFTREALLRLIAAWNQSHSEAPISGLTRKSVPELWKALQTRMMPKCGSGSNQEGCWVDTLLGENVTSTDALANASEAGAGAGRIQGILPVVKSLKPRKPKEWAREPFTWLTNFDIEAVMHQYETDTPAYRFLGVYPIDFAGKSAFGTCLFAEICAMRIAPLVKKGVRYLGMILNLDKHDQSGSHWTSLFMCIDPALPCYGAYYYDSVARKTPSEVGEFIETVRGQLAELYGTGTPFKADYNRNQHQYADTECGVFSMIYQIRWLNLLEKRRGAVTFGDIVNIKITDKDVHKLRDVLYRPPTTRA